MRSFAVLLLAVGLVAAAPAGASTGTTKPTTLTILVGKHGVAGGLKKFTVKKNAHVVLRIRSSIGKQVHLHGYDIERAIRNARTYARMAFVARVRGVFEIELHLGGSRDLQIGQLTVK
ncbi:MAG TPA: hypothetical protein VFA44_09560 [Gaiellaceae bacterium]|nr:hypothetical protein [Gaiellaceae bacterium]